MFKLFNFSSNQQRALRDQIAARTRLLERAMAKYGVNSSQARDFEAQIDELEAQLKAA